ncbi:MAG: hypothetical protein SOW59_08830, partial [Corynebacterium sp.]|nr:hypothetical protein [Corynebacterium sp.]
MTSVASAQTANKLEITPNNPTVTAGDQATFTVSWACNNPTGCAGAKIVVPFPSVNDSELTPINGVSATASNGGYSTDPIKDDRARKFTWTLKDNVPVGTSGAMTFTIKTPGRLVPNGATITPSATFTLADGSQALTTTASSPTTVTSNVNLIVDKRALNQDKRVLPGGSIYYQVSGMHKENFNSNTGQTGNNVDYNVEGFKSLVLSDTHAAGSEFVRATLVDGTWIDKAKAIELGYYNEATRTFTWPEWKEVGIGANGMYTPNPPGSIRNNIAPHYTIEIKYPDGVFDPAATVNNVANATATTLSGRVVTGSDDAPYRLAEKAGEG